MEQKHLIESEVVMAAEIKVLAPKFLDKTVWYPPRTAYGTRTEKRIPIYEELLEDSRHKVQPLEQPVMDMLAELLGPVTHGFIRQVARVDTLGANGHYYSLAELAPDETKDILKVIKKWRNSPSLLSADPRKGRYGLILDQLKNVVVSDSSKKTVDALVASFGLSRGLYLDRKLTLIIEASQYINLPDAPDVDDILLFLAELEVYAMLPTQIPNIDVFRSKLMSRRGDGGTNQYPELVGECVGAAGEPVFSLTSGQAHTRKSGFMVLVNAIELIEPAKHMFKALKLEGNASLRTSQIWLGHELSHLLAPDVEDARLVEWFADLLDMESCLSMAEDGHWDAEETIHIMALICSCYIAVPDSSASNDSGYKTSALAVLSLLTRNGVLEWDKVLSRPVISKDKSRLQSCVRKFAQQRIKYYKKGSTSLPNTTVGEDGEKIINWYLQFKKK